jgi:vancomycin permeability regulator SanA
MTNKYSHAISRNIKAFFGYIKSNFVGLIALAVGLLLVVTLASYLVIQRENDKIFDLNDPKIEDISQQITVGIVFGSGVNDEEPLQLVKDRLHRAKDLLDRDLVQKLILSGDNRSLEYNEPAIMFDYLVNTLGVSPDNLQPDFAGRSTYETCERANKVFGVSKALLVSESTHLPRAIYLCSHFDIEAYGIKSDGLASSGLKIGQRWREVLARFKAVFNIYVIGENTILGDKIEL